MKQFYTLMLLMLAGLSVSAQTSGDYRSRASGNWSDLGTWERYNGGTWQTLNGTGQRVPPTSTNANAITIRNNHTVTVTASVIADQLRVDDGTLTINAGVTLTIVDGTGTDLTIDAGETMNVNGTLRLNGGTIASAATTLFINAGGTYEHNRDDGTIPTATWDDASTCLITGVIDDLPDGFGQSFGHFTWNSTGQDEDLSFAAALTTIDGNFTVVSTGTGSIRLKNGGGGTTSTTVGGDFILTGGELYIVGSSDTHNLLVNGNVSISGGELIRGGGTANFVFDRNGAQSFQKTGGTIVGVVNFRVDDGSIVDFGTSILDGTSATFRVDEDGTLITSHDQGFYAAGNLGSVRVGGSRSFDNGANYEFRGATTGVFSSQAKDITINRTGGNVTLSQSMTVSRRLYLQAGEFHTATGSVITIGSGANATGVAALTSNVYNASSFVVGPIRVTRNNNGNFVFPTGKTGVGLLPIGISNVGVSGGGGSTATYEAQYNALAASTVGPIRTSVVHADGCQYWDLRSVSGNATGAGVVTMYWNSVSQCSSIPYIVNPMSVGMVRAINAPAPNNGWTSTGGTVVMPGSTNTAGSINWTLTAGSGFASSSMFAISSSNASESPLPVMMDGFVAYLKNGGVQIDWSNLTEKDVIVYQVERSANGRDFTVIDEQEPKSNDNAKASYTSFDEAPLEGTNYYRIHVQEKAGKFFYSKILRVDINSSKKGFVVYPNPVVGREMKLQLANLKIGPYQVKVVSVSGQVVYQKTVSNYGSSTTISIELPASLQAGVYTMNVSGSDYQQSKNIIVK